MLTPSMGRWAMPFTWEGSGMPAAASTVGATSMTWVNWERTSPRAAIPFGQWTIVPLRVPPQCEATCLVHWYGVPVAWAQPTAKWLYAAGVPNSSIRAAIDSAVSSCAAPFM